MEYYIIPFLICLAVSTTVLTLWRIIGRLKSQLTVANDAVEGYSNLLQRFNADQQVIEMQEKMYIVINEN